jgi:DNA/RNA-binding domain of Phe-tRNA-synthetase-like protein
VWRDDAGVTCRRWNWRQGRRTQITEATTSAFFIVDTLIPPLDATALAAVLEDLTAQLRDRSPGAALAAHPISVRG